MANKIQINTNEYNFFDYEKFDIRNDIDLPKELIVAIPFVDDINENVADKKYTLSTRVVSEGFYKPLQIAGQNFIQCNNTYFIINTDNMKNILFNFQMMFENEIKSDVSIVQIKNIIILYNDQDKKIYFYDINSNSVKSIDIDLQPNDINAISIDIDLINSKINKFFLNFEDFTNKIKDDPNKSFQINKNNRFRESIVIFNSEVDNSLFQQAAISNISILESWKYNNVDNIKNLMNLLVNIKVNKDTIWSTKMDPFEDGTEKLFIPFGLLDDNVLKDFDPEALPVDNITYTFYDNKKSSDIFKNSNLQPFTFEYGKNVTHFGYEKLVSNLSFTTNFEFNKNTISFIAIFQHIDFNKVADSDINILQTDLFTIFYNNKALYGMYKTDKTTKKLLYTFENNLIIPEHLHIFIDIDKDNKKIIFQAKSIDKESDSQEIEINNFDLNQIQKINICENSAKDYLIGISNLRIFNRILADFEKNLLFAKEQPFRPFDRDLFNKDDFLDFRISYLFDAKKRNSAYDINENNIYISDPNSVSDEKICIDIHNNKGIYLNKSLIQIIDEKPLYVLSINQLSSSKRFRDTEYYNTIPIIKNKKIYLSTTANIDLKQNGVLLNKFNILHDVMSKIYDSCYAYTLNITQIIDKINKKIKVFINGIKILEIDQFLLKNIDSNYSSNNLNFWHATNSFDGNSNYYNLYCDLILFNTNYFNENQIPFFTQVTTFNPKYIKNNYFKNYIDNFFDFEKIVKNQCKSISQNNMILYEVNKPIILYKDLPLTIYFQNKFVIKLSFDKKSNVKLYNMKIYNDVFNNDFIIYTDNENLKIDLVNIPTRYQSYTLNTVSATINIEKLDNLAENINLYVYFLDGILYVYIDNILKFKANVNIFNINTYLIGGLNIDSFSLPS